MARRAPPASIPKVLKSTTGVAGELVGQPAANGQIRKFWTFEFDFLAIPLLVFASLFFCETTGSDLSNGLGLVSVDAL